MSINGRFEAEAGIDIDMEKLYSLENARRFKWSSVSGSLNPERIKLLEGYVEGIKILDAGCAGGGYVRFLKENGFDACGMDCHLEFIRLAKDADPAGSYVLGDLTSLPFADKSFDCSICLDVIEHIHNDKQALSELIRVTNKRIILSIPRHNDDIDIYNLTFLHYSDKTHIKNYTEDLIYELISSFNVNSFVVNRELPVPLKNLFINMMDTYPSTSKGSTLKKFIFEYLSRYVIKNINFKKIYTGFVVVIDLK